ncbi:hypothetical protein [Pseudomonas sp. CGJS7]|uniref:hypothetical protein n=1 Tax=Pseudomonas sp. CGJS7 TaxID=3109348 RepID=UPI00300A1067
MTFWYKPEWAIDFSFFAAKRRSRYNITTITTITDWCGTESLIAHLVTQGYDKKRNTKGRARPV